MSQYNNKGLDPDASITSQDNDNEESHPHISIISQYIKDFSFENPNAPHSLIKQDSPPKVDLTLDLNIKKIPDIENTFEVSMQVEAEAINEGKRLFFVELSYAGLFNLINIPQEHLELVLAIDCAAMIFPFARKIIADVTQDSGFQALKIDPIDFGRLYQRKVMDRLKDEQPQ